jgi:hypothetical protein
MAKRKLIEDYEIVDHGIENSQYFQGCGTSLTEFEQVATGIGDNPKEAIEDALDQLAQMGWDTDSNIELTTEVEECKDTPSVQEEYEDSKDKKWDSSLENEDEEENDDSDIDDDDYPDDTYYYLSIRVK